MPTKAASSGAKQKAASKTPPPDAPTKKTAATPKAKAAPAKSQRAGTKAELYTKPKLRERLKEQIKSGDKGGRPGQWSARKAQLLASEYEQEGGGYTPGGPTKSQRHLQSWTEEKWRTADGKDAARGKTTARYLPKDAWEKLSPAERKATDEKKRSASRTGQQFVSNTPAAKKARKAATQS